MERNILETENEKRFDKSARALAKRVYAEVEGQPLGKRPLSKAVHNTAKYINSLKEAIRQYNRGVSKTKENVLQQRKALKGAILTLERKHYFLDRRYDFSDSKDTDTLFMYAEAYIERVTYYIEEINQVKRFISEAEERAAAK